MKTKVVLSMLFAAMPLLQLMAQDDLYFVPTKENVEKQKASYGMPANTYYAGSSRSVDEYNRRNWNVGSANDSIGNDIIDFAPEKGVYPDSVIGSASDYQYTQRMSRFDDYTPSRDYWRGYSDGYRSSAWSGWVSSWYYPWYDAWYDPWYDPWYYNYGGYWGWHSPYYSPWYYGRYGYYGHYWSTPYYIYGGGGGYGHAHAGRSWSRTGASHHRNIDGSSQRGTNLGGYRSSVQGRNATTTGTTSGTRNLGGNRSYSTPRSSSISTGSSGGSYSSRSSSSSSGGRSMGGGRSFGGRR